VGGVSAVEWWCLGWGWRGLRERWGRIGLRRGKVKGEGGVRMAVVAMGDSVRVRELVEDEVLQGSLHLRFCYNCVSIRRVTFVVLTFRP